MLRRIFFKILLITCIVLLVDSSPISRILTLLSLKALRTIIFLVASGPLSQQEGLFTFLERLNCVDPCDQFTELRNLVSLFPRNEALLDWMSALLKIRSSHGARRLRDRCAGKDVILHITCRKSLHHSRRSAKSFAESGCVSVMVVGSDKDYPQKFGFEFDGELMVLPVPDTYEQLASKVFYAYLVLSMCARPSLVVKLMMM